MFRKVTFLESKTLEVFFGFVQHVKTQTWISGIEISPAQYSGKPSEGDRRAVTVWQGSKNSCHQKLEIHFFYTEDYGGWNLNGVVFSGISPNGDEGSKWSQAFRGGPRHDNNYVWKFVPVRFDGRYFKDYELSDPAQNEEFELACRGRYPRIKTS